MLCSRLDLRWIKVDATLNMTYHNTEAIRFKRSIVFMHAFCLAIKLFKTNQTHHERLPEPKFHFLSFP